MYNPSLTLEDIVKIIQSTHKRRKDIKLKSESLSLEYRTQLALAKEEAGEVKASEYIRSLTRIENQRKLFRDIRYIENKVKKILVKEYVKCWEVNENIRKNRKMMDHIKQLRINEIKKWYRQYDTLIIFFSSRRRHTRSSTVSWAR